MTRATVITDASFCPNTKAAGWAAWVRVDGVEEPIKRSAMFKQPVNQSAEAEMLAAINGTWLASTHGATVALVETDCLAVVHMINNMTRRSDLRIAFQAAIIRAGIEHMILHGRHVKGHTTLGDARSYVNRWCDKHAKIAMNQMRSLL